MPKGEKPKSRLFTQGVEDVGGSGGEAAGLRHEERVAVAVIAAGPLGKVLGVKVGRVEIEGGAGGLPDIDDPGLGASAGEAARRGVVAGQPGVDVHGQVVGGLALGGHRLDEAGVLPGHEDFVGAIGVAEDLGPGARGLVAVLVPECAEAGIERVAVRLEISGELGRNVGGEGAVGGLGVVAGVAEDADFVFDLHHQHGVVAAVDFLDVAHEGGEGARVGLLRGFALGREDFDFSAVGDDAGKAARILLDPGGRVAGHAVLPGSEPEKDDALVVLTGLGEEAVDESEVEDAFPGLDELPTERSDHGVEVDGGQLGPDGLHVVEAGGGGVVQFAAEDEEGLAVDDELGGRAALFEMRGAVGLRGKRRGGKAGEEQKDWQRLEAGFHNGREFSTGDCPRHMTGPAATCPARAAKMRGRGLSGGTG